MKRLFVILCLLAAVSAQGQTLSLERCLEIARNNNFEIRSSQIEVEKAEALKDQVFTKYFPQVSAGWMGYYALHPLIRFGIEDIESEDLRALMQVVYDNFSPGTDMQSELELMKWGLNSSLLAAQPIFAGGRIVNGNKLAGLGVEASKLQARMKSRDVLEEVESSFYLALGLEEKVSTVETALSLIDSLGRIVDVAFANGLVTKSDALQIELKRNEMLANKQKLTSGIRLSKRFLCEQIGIDYSDTLSLVEPSAEELPPLAYVYSSTGNPYRPEARLLELNVQAEELRRKMTVGEALPQLTFIGGASYGNMIKTDPTFNAVAVLSLTIPLTAWWETSHKLKQHDASIRQAKMTQEKYTRMMSLEEEKAYSDMMDAWTLLTSDNSALELARENYRLSTLNYEAGTVTLSDVLQAQALLLQAINAMTDRRMTYIVARRRLLDLGNN